MRLIRSCRNALAVCAGVVGLLAALAAPARAIPSFARQTKLPCSACHTQFPELNAFGRVFKLNGYTLRMIETIEAGDTLGHQDLSINLMPLPSVMVQASETYTQRPQGATTNGTVSLPQQLSVFLAGAITPKVGAFIQVTYSPDAGTVEMDNASIRFATPVTLAAKPGIFGLSLNNNPTVQDVWASTPAWGFPFEGSAVAPTPAAATLVDGGLAEQVAGLSAYLFWNDALYVEAGAYRWAPQGAPQIPDGTVKQVVDGVAPYWRVALTHSFGDNYVMVGTYGLYARRQPASFVNAGATDTYSDIAFDAQWQRPLGANDLTVTATWIHETRALGASKDSGLVAVSSQTVNTFRARATLHVGQRYAFTVGPFVTTGTADSVLYASGALSGSSTHSPNSAGAIAEVDWNVWMNARLSLQYTYYTKFNGASTNYDGAGRNASDNNTLYAVIWLMF
ncbi:MAG TPA: hypothetical protein VEH62_02730 [Gemmatimonadales bacterium]|nr:hypothetical protein [Gemmatimonadales bacterium]